MSCEHNITIIHPNTHLRISSGGIQGAQGIQGDPNGTSGTAGSSGSSGTSGYGSSGSSGTSGKSGSSGSSGFRGAHGTSGTSGTNGTSGSNGSSGSSGTSGTSGTSGSSAEFASVTISETAPNTGTQGKLWFNSDEGTLYVEYADSNGTNWIPTNDLRGADGTSGTSGTNGTTGTAGSTGTAGTAGTSGTTGSTGTSGTSATDGSAGTSGTSGTSGLDGLFIGTFNSLSDLLTAYPTPINNYWAFVKDIDPTILYAYRPDPSGWVYETIILPSGTSGTNGTDGTSAQYAAVYIAEQAPTTETNGKFWFNDNEGTLYIQYEDTNGTNWIPVNDLVGADGTSGTSGTSATSGTSGSSGTSGTSGVRGEHYRTFSTTSFTLGNAGTMGIETNLGYSVAQSIIISYDLANNQISPVVSYNKNTGELIFDTPVQTNGSGTYSNWIINLAGAAGGDGSSGTSGVDGLVGTDGTSGTSGIGTDGSSGTSGVNGESGSSGTSGESGSSGTSFYWQADYNSSTSYYLNDVVYYSGSSYISIYNGHDNHIPSSTPSRWSPMALAGTSGASGSSGTSGVSGSSGTSGVSGSSGTSGVSGSSGTSGISGSSGTSGLTGTNGSAGTSGLNGTNGSTGTSGLNGTNGSGGTSGLTIDTTLLNNFTGSIQSEVVGIEAYTASLKSAGLVSGSLIPTSSYSVVADGARTIDVFSAGIDFESYPLFSNVIAASGVAVSGDTNLRYNSSTNVLTVPTISATTYLGGVVSGSAQLTQLNTFTGSIQNEVSGIEVYTASLKGASIVSSSTQIQNYNLFATTGSNTFVGNQTINGTTKITGSLIVSGALTTNIISGGLDVFGGITGSLKGNVAGTATYSNLLNVGNSSTNQNYAIPFTTAGQNGYMTLYTDLTGGPLYNPSTNKMELTGSLNVTGSVTINSGSITMPDRPAFRVAGSGVSVAATKVLSGSNFTADYSQGSGWNPSSGSFTAPIAGLYQVNLIARASGNSNPAAQIIVYKNNTVLTPSPDGTPQIMIEWAANTTVNHIGGSTISKLAVGDTLKAIVTVGTVTFDGNDSFSVAYIG